MNYWLVKSEPSVYSFDKLVEDGETRWDGVRNYAARLHLRAMKKGDQVLFYHSNEGMEIVGIAKVSKEAYQDPTTTEDWSCVDLKPVKKLKKSVSLAAVKADKSLKDIPLVRIPRLSVMPVTGREFERITGMSA
jgi:predicted RNA-binding protein with PUA-like domain